MSDKISNFPNAKMKARDPDIVRTEVEIFKYIADLPPINKDSAAEVKVRIDDYLKICSEHGLMPTIQGVSLALHIHRSSFWLWCNEQSERGQVCQMFKVLQAAMTENGLLDGTINTIGALFTLKNHHGYKDAVSIDTDISPALDRLPTAEEIKNRLMMVESGKLTDSTSKKTNEITRYF